MSSFKSNNDAKSLSEDKLEAVDENLWLGILSQVQKGSSPNKLPSCKNVLVLGDNGSGKTSLIAKLQGNEDPKKGSGIEFHYIDVRDEYRDDHTRLGIYVLDGDPWHRNLLKFVLNEDTFSDTTVLLTAAMTAPWDILESLQNWIYILEEHVQRLRLPDDLLEQHRNKLSKRFHDYLEPGAEIDGVGSVTSPLKATHGSPENFKGDIKVNLGLDIICVITKTDYMTVLENECDYKDEYFDFIQLCIRNFCLLYGASLIYVSVKEDKNTDLLFKYLIHRIYSFPFRTPALVVEKDGVFMCVFSFMYIFLSEFIKLKDLWCLVFILNVYFDHFSPSGWDCSSKTSILIDNLQSIKPDDPYNEVIIKPLNRKPQGREAEITAEDDQEFLIRLQSLINQQVPASIGRPVSSQETPMRTPPGVQKTAERRISGSPGMQSSPKKIEGKAGTVGGEGVLQNFFNSLLNRRTGSPIGGPLASVRSPGDTRQVSARHDAVAELDRMSGLQRSKKAPSFSQSEPSPLTSEDTDTDTSSMKS